MASRFGGRVKWRDALPPPHAADRLGAGAAVAGGHNVARTVSQGHVPLDLSAIGGMDKLKPMFRFKIRDLLWAMVVVGLALG